MRRDVRIGAIVAAAGIGLAALAAWWWLPAWVERRAERVVRESLGLDSHVGAVAIGPEGTLLEDVELRSLSGGLHVTIDRVEASYDLLRLARGGREAIDRISARGVAVTLARPREGEGGPSPRESLDEPSSPGGSRGLVRRISRWMHMLAPDAVLDVQDMTVRAASVGRAPATLHDLTLRIERRGGARLHSAGTGRAGQSGRLDWDVDLQSGRGRLACEDLPLSLVAGLLPRLPWQDDDRATLDADLQLAGLAGERLSVDGVARIDHVVLDSTLVAEAPVELPALSLAGAWTLEPGQRRFGFDGTRLGFDRASIVLDGALQWTAEGYRIDLDATLPATSCAEAVGAIPDGLLEDLRGFTFRGQISGRARARVDSRALERTDLVLEVSDRCVFESVPPFADPSQFRGAFVHRVYEPDGSTSERISGPGSAGWVPLEAVSPYLVHAVLAHEDAGFFRHRGFAPWAIRDALVRNLERGRFSHGASTISMQLAKNLFLEREKTVARKVQEVLLTWWLERELTKREILALYLNVIEYGPGIYGIDDATRHYFARRPAELTPAEAAFLATILPDPAGYHRAYERRTLGPGLRSQIEELLRHMHDKERIGAEALQHGLAELEAFSFNRPPDAGAAHALAGGAAPLPDDGGARADGAGSRFADR